MTPSTATNILNVKSCVSDNNVYYTINVFLYFGSDNTKRLPGVSVVKEDIYFVDESGDI